MCGSEENSLFTHLKFKHNKVAPTGTKQISQRLLDSEVTLLSAVDFKPFCKPGKNMRRHYDQFEPIEWYTEQCENDSIYLAVKKEYTK